MVEPRGGDGYNRTGRFNVDFNDGDIYPARIEIPVLRFEFKERHRSEFYVFESGDLIAYVERR